MSPTSNPVVTTCPFLGSSRDAQVKTVGYGNKTLEIPPYIFLWAYGDHERIKCVLDWLSVRHSDFWCLLSQVGSLSDHTPSTWQVLKAEPTRTYPSMQEYDARDPSVVEGNVTEPNTMLGRGPQSTAAVEQNIKSETQVRRKVKLKFVWCSVSSTNVCKWAESLTTAHSSGRAEAPPPPAGNRGNRSRLPWHPPCCQSG